MFAQGSITMQLSEKCQKCQHVKNCDEKRMESCAYINSPEQCMSDASMPLSSCASADVLVSHDYRDIKINSGVTVPLDLEKVKMQMKKDFYKGIGLCLEFGA